MQNRVEIVVVKTLERPPLNSCSRYYKLYLPKDIIIDTNQYKLVNLNFVGGLNLWWSPLAQIIPKTKTDDKKLCIIKI